MIGITVTFHYYYHYYCCILCCIAMNNYTYTCMQKHIQHNNDEWTQFFRKIYLSLYWKGCVLEGVGDRTKTATYCPPPIFWLSQSFFPILLGCSTGGLGAQPLLGHGSHSSIFSPTDLNFLSPGLYNNLTPTYLLRASQFALNSTRQQSRPPPDILERMHLLFTQMHFFFWQLGWVGGQYATLRAKLLKLVLIWDMIIQRNGNMDKEIFGG